MQGEGIVDELLKKDKTKKTSNGQKTNEEAVYGNYVVQEDKTTGEIVVTHKSDKYPAMIAARQKDNHPSIVSFGKSGKKFGYLDSDKKIFIPPIMDRQVELSSDRLLVAHGSQYAFFDTGGKAIGKKVFDKAFAYSDGLASVRKNDELYYIDTVGKKSIEGNYDKAYDFCEGLAVVENGGREYYIDKKGANPFGKTFEEAHSFSEGIAGVKEKGKYYFINKQGKMLYGPFDEVGGFVNGKALVRINGQTKFICK